MRLVLKPWYLSGLCVGLLLWVLCGMAQAAQVTLAWDYTPAPGVPPVSFQIQKCALAAQQVSCTPSDMTGGTTTTKTWVDTTVVQGVAYCYAVVAVPPPSSGWSRSDPSNVDCGAIFGKVPGAGGLTLTFR